MNLLCLKLCRAYSISVNSSDVGNFFWSYILKHCIKVQEKKKESCCLLFRPRKNREIRQFHVVVVQQRQRNVQKKRDHVQSSCFASINLLLCFRSRCRRRRRCLCLISPLTARSGEIGGNGLMGDGGSHHFARQLAKFLDHLKFFFIAISYHHHHHHCHCHHLSHLTVNHLKISLIGAQSMSYAYDTVLQ